MMMSLLQGLLLKQLEATLMKLEIWFVEIFYKKSTLPPLSSIFSICLFHGTNEQMNEQTSEQTNKQMIKQRMKE